MNILFLNRPHPYINLTHTLGKHWHSKTNFIVMSSLIATIFNKVNCSKDVSLQNVIICHGKELDEINRNVASFHSRDFTSDFLLLDSSVDVPKLPGRISVYTIKVSLNTFIKFPL